MDIVKANEQNRDYSQPARPRDKDVKTMRIFGIKTDLDTEQAPFGALYQADLRRIKVNMPPMLALVSSVIFGMSFMGNPAVAQNTLSFEVTPFKQALAESIGQDDEVAAFYRARQFAPIWTGADDESLARRAAFLEALASAEHHGLPQSRFNEDALLSRMTGITTDRDLGALEVELSHLYLDYAHSVQSGLIDNPGTIDGDIKRRPIRRSNSDLLDLLVEERPKKAFQSLAPQSPEYVRLMREKLRLQQVVSGRGWGAQIPEGKLELGDKGASVVRLRDRLVAMGFLAPSLSATFDDRMKAAVESFQNAHGLLPDGVAGPATLREINVEPIDRLQSVIVAMERERWLNLPDGRGKRHIWVNLVDFHARILDDGKTSFSTRSVIGHRDPDRRSPEFSDVMEHMVINPTWYVPRSIIVNEYLPQLRNNPNAVSHLQVVNRQGQVIDRSIGFAGYSARSFPFSMRQPPGPKNALGTVKFMFPNKYNIYLHDTPSKSLFNRESRAFSHGCIRLADPHDFAYALLSKQEDAPEAFFQSILRNGKERRVNLKEKVPVHLVYRTAYTQPKGPMNYRGDVYGRDAKIWSELARLGVVLGGADS